LQALNRSSNESGRSRLKLNFAMVNTRGSRDFIEGWQRHHLIPKQCTRDARTRGFFSVMHNVGFRLNDFRTNGILLPSTQAQAALASLPVHSGPHPEYNLRIIDAVGFIARQFNFAEDPREAHAALSHIRLVQARLRVSMYQDTPVSVDSIETPSILRRSRVIDRAIETLMNKPCIINHPDAPFER
jgi:hypothetical protein